MVLEKTIIIALIIFFLIVFVPQFLFEGIVGYFTILVILGFISYFIEPLIPFVIIGAIIFFVRHREEIFGDKEFPNDDDDEIGTWKPRKHKK